MKLRTPFIALVVLASSPVAAPAVAQNAQTPGTQTPTPGVIPPELGSGRTQNRFEREFDNRKLMDPTSAGTIHESAGEIAACIARRSRGKAASYLGGVLAHDEDYARISEALTGRLRTCANIEGRATAIAISGVLAEQLVLEEPPALEDRAPMVSEDAAHEFFGELTGPVTFDNVAGCLAVYSPGLAYKVVQTKAGSNEETAALQAIYAQTPECRMSAPPDSIPPLYQRGALATALYLWNDRRS